MDAKEKYKAILFDLIGTTVKEKDPNTILNCFRKAFEEYDVWSDMSLLQKHRGKDKLEMIHLILDHQKMPRSLAHRIYKAFKRNLIDSLSNFAEFEGARETFSFLRKHGILVGIGTAMERDLFEKILNHLQWKKEWFDYIGISSEVGRNRPNPDMIWDMMKVLNITSTASVIKVGDTITDIQEGRNTGSPTIAFASGTQSISALENEKPDFTIRSLIDIQSILLKEWRQSKHTVNNGN
jgi:HAD superfamily hydrolase (TIGR01549 family)